MEILAVGRLRVEVDAADIERWTATDEDYPAMIESRASFNLISFVHHWIYQEIHALPPSLKFG
jgi:hypothetical protein